MKYIKLCGGKEIDERMPDLTNKRCPGSMRKICTNCLRDNPIKNTAVALKDSAENSRNKRER